jgi:hypothetical protein
MTKNWVVAQNSMLGLEAVMNTHQSQETKNQQEIPMSDADELKKPAHHHSNDANSKCTEAYRQNRFG